MNISSQFITQLPESRKKKFKNNKLYACIENCFNFEQLILEFHMKISIHRLEWALLQQALEHKPK
jgi:hypothetical protein